MTNPQLRLTQTVQKGGCAAKIAAVELRKILKQVRFPPTHEAVLVDSSLFDDAAVYKVHESLALVQTLDFFTPIVDSPALFGKIAAANALSDVYAMGGNPQTAMAILGFPIMTLGNEVASEILQGASDILTEAQVPLVGGHSIDDETLKFGLSVTGFVDPKRVWSNAGAKAGDCLILTKSLGTGTLTAALKRSEVTESDIGEAIDSMVQINRILDLLGDDAASIHAATDITGFGLLGHALQMAKASQKTFAIVPGEVPRLAAAAEFISRGFLTKAHRSNAYYVEKEVEFGALDEFAKLLFFDPQTSGGLLLSVAEDRATGILEKLKRRFTNAQIIGRVENPAEKPIKMV